MPLTPTLAWGRCTRSTAISRLCHPRRSKRGRRVPILGAPSLEYTRIDLTGVPGAEVGDEVVIIGEQDGTRIAPEEVVTSQCAARISDLALEVRESIPRLYLGAS